MSEIVVRRLLIDLGTPFKRRWNGGDAPVLMTGPATTVFEGEIDLPDTL